MKIYQLICPICQEPIRTSSETKVRKALSRHEKNEHPFLAYKPPTVTRTCDEPLCEASVKDHYWGKIRAHHEGWFFTKDGQSWCPAHLPDWVEAWRKNKQAASS